jgi:lysophospholipase L1-like esterase
MGKKCSCSDPTTAKSREGQRHWLKTVRQNSDAALSSKDVDVVFLGDSITEGFKGTSYGFEEGRKEENLKVFNSLFTTEGGGKYEGLALGIAGDTSTNLLWRIQNGELPSSLNPIAIWLLIGTNDFGNTWCSPEAVLIGILRVVEELRMRNPESTIVINGLLPRSYDKKSGYVMRPNQNTPFRHDRKNKPPALWNDIVSINKQLKEYSENHKKVAYFDASDIFLMDHSRSNMEVDELQINEHLMADYLHPTALGYKLWGDAIVDFLDELSL